MAQHCLSQFVTERLPEMRVGGFETCLSPLSTSKTVYLPDGFPENLVFLLSSHLFICHLSFCSPSWNVKRDRFTKPVSEIGQNSPFSGNPWDWTLFCSIQKRPQTCLVSTRWAGVGGWPWLAASPQPPPPRDGSIGAGWNCQCPAQGRPSLSSQRLPLQPLTAGAPAPATTGQTVCGERVSHSFGVVYLNQLNGQISFSQEKRRSSLDLCF